MENQAVLAEKLDWVVENFPYLSPCLRHRWAFLTTDVQKCVTDSNGNCIKCMRTKDEIVRWRQGMSEEEKLKAIRRACSHENYPSISEEEWQSAELRKANEF